MWTGSFRWVPAVVLTAALASCASPGVPQEPVARESGLPDAAWWYGLELEPRGGEVRGIAVAEFSPDWSTATALGEQMLARHVPAEGFAPYRASGFSFVVTQDLDGDGAGEEVFVGTFETRSGTRGRFLAVSREGRLVQHFEHSGSAGFSALLPVEGGVRWYKCLDCGEYESLSWTGGSYVLD